MTAREIRLNWMALATPGDWMRVHLDSTLYPPRLIAVMRQPYFANNGEVA